MLDIWEYEKIHLVNLNNAHFIYIKFIKLHNSSVVQLIGG